MRTVLIVEDDPVVSESLELALLILPGIAVRSVSSVEQARDALSTDERFDAVITDVHLPGEDGLSLVASMLRMPARCNLPVVITTSSREPSIRRRAAEMGVKAFLEKPWSAKELRNTLHSLFDGT
ncbi:MAG: response regulator [Bryobacteraceae bacterium]|nr:response regulator [Bryobacteraceae bacterium]